MALFQSTVVQKYINAQDKNVLERKWEAYKTHFHNPCIQENIRNAKEEQFTIKWVTYTFITSYFKKSTDANKHGFNHLD